MCETPTPKPETVISIKEVGLNFDDKDLHELESRTRLGIKHVTMKNEQFVLIISTNLYKKRRSCCCSIHVTPLYVVAPLRTSTLISQRTLADCHLLLFQHFSISPCSLCSRTFLCSSHLYLFSPITQFLPNSEPLEPDHSHKPSTSKLRHDVLGMRKYISCYRQHCPLFRLSFS